MAELLIHRADQPLRQRSLFPHWVDEHVRWSDTDMIGHVNNLAFAAYLETGRALFLRHFTSAEGPSRALFVLGEMTTRFLGEAHWPAAIEVGTGVVVVGRRTVRLAQGLFDGDRCIATSESALVLLDETTRKSRDIPEEIKSWLNAQVLSFPERPVIDG
ncbi:MAG: putative thioesterase [Nevskia sp.]|nr:putative thioesterase [Nevskia sp.]